MDRLKSIHAGDLNIAYHEYGPYDGEPAVLLHGFPYDVRAYDDVAAELVKDNILCLVPYLRGYGPTTFLSDDTLRSGQQAALAYDLLAFMDALCIPNAVLAGYDWGGRAACIVAALWPERVTGLVSGGQGYNIQDIPNAWKPVSAAEEMRFWYIYYFNTKRGNAGLLQNRNDICQHIWSTWSPTWRFNQADFDASAKSFENPDFVEIVTHSYRHRLGGIAGDPRFDEIEAQLAAQPSINIPTIVLQGADDGLDPPAVDDPCADHFSSSYERIIIQGTGHNLPQEAPKAFAEAVASLTTKK